MNSITRFFTAFITALRMTVRGEKPAPSPYAGFKTWAQETAQQVDAILQAADAAGMDEKQRRAVIFTAEGRRTNMQAVLAGVRFHAIEEYPHLLAQGSQSVIGAIYGTNVNDRFLIFKLAETLPDSGLKAAVERLGTHLEAVPQLPEDG